MRRIASIAALLLISCSALPALGQFTTVINVPTDPPPLQLASNTQLNVYAGAYFPDGVSAGIFQGNETNIEVNLYDAMYGFGVYANHGATINVFGGPTYLVNSSSGSTVNVWGGTLTMDVSAGGAFKIFDGAIANYARAQPNAAVSIGGGSIGADFRNYGTLTITGGEIGARYESEAGSHVHMSGGAFADGADFNGALDIYGDEFYVNGSPVAGLNNVGDTLQITLINESIFSGLLTSGESFNFWRHANTLADSIDVITLHRTNVSATPLVANVPVDPAPAALRAGGTLNLSAGGALRNNFVSLTGSTLNMTGGSIGTNYEAVDTTLTVSGGTIGDGFELFAGSIANISGGTFSGTIDIHSGVHADLSGGSVLGTTTVLAGGSANVSGGIIGGDLFVYETASISGGNVVGKIYAFKSVTIAGGTSGDGLTVSNGKKLTLEGEDFRVNDVPIAALANVGDQLQYNLPAGSLLTGTLADGTPFYLSSLETDSIANGTLTLKHVAVAAAQPVVNVPSEPAPLGIRAGQQLNLASGGALGDNFSAGRGSTLQVAGGSIGKNLEAVGAVVHMTGGAIGTGADVVNGAQVNMTGGSIGTSLAVYAGGVANIGGGSVGSINVSNNGTLSITGGVVGAPTFGSVIGIASGGQANLSGGAIGAINASTGSQLKIYASDFRLDGVPISGLDIVGQSKSYNPNVDQVTGKYAVLTGVYADGTPFSIQHGGSSYISWMEDAIASGAVTLIRSQTPPVRATLYNVPSDVAPLGVGQGETLNLAAGGTLGDHFNAGYGSAVNITGGTVGTDFEAAFSTVNISGGTFGPHMDAHTGSVFNITGGYFGRNFEAHSGSVVNLRGGSIEQSFLARRGSVVNMTGGSIGGNSDAFGGTVNFAGGTIARIYVWTGGVFNQTGGTVTAGTHTHAQGQLNILAGVSDGAGCIDGGEANVLGGSFTQLFANEGTMNVAGGQIQVFYLESTGKLNLFGTQFLLNGVPMSNLSLGTAFTVTNRIGTLSGTLMDGSAFSVGLDYQSAASTLTVTRLNAFKSGDFDRNGVIDARDYVFWRNSLGQSVAKGAAADGNFNGFVDQGDYVVWRFNFGGTSGSGSSTIAATPEPASATLLLIAGSFVFACRIRPRG